MLLKVPQSYLWSDGKGLGYVDGVGAIVLYGLGRLARSNPSLECALMVEWPPPSSVQRMPFSGPQWDSACFIFKVPSRQGMHSRECTGEGRAGQGRAGKEGGIGPGEGEEKGGQMLGEARRRGPVCVLGSE